MCKSRWSVLALILMLAAGCGGGDKEVVLLSKDFSEQAILAEMAVTLLRDAGIPVSMMPSVTDSYQAQAYLREGTANLMVDYSGTALNFLGESATANGSSVEETRVLYEPLGIDWLAPLGFDNGYVVLVPASRAAAMGLQTIEDLADPERFPEGVRIACPPEYLRRPGDGLGPLVEAYGIQQAAPPLVIPDVIERMRALEARRADVAIGFGTDGVIPAFGLRVLDDSLGFFPSYEAAFVIRHETREAMPQIASILDKLGGRIDPSTMRRLNAEVEVQGKRPVMVAREFLMEEGLLSRRPEEGLIPSATDLDLAISRFDDFQELRARAIVAIHASFPDRPVSELLVDDPTEVVARGRARLALVGAERFFSDSENGLPDRENRLEAVAVVGTRLLHVVRRAGDDSDDPLSGRVGVPPEKSGAGLVARRILGEERSPDLSGTTSELLEAVRENRLDVALIVLPVGDLEPIWDETSGVQLELRSLENWLTPSRAVRMPYLRPARIAAGSYLGQDKPIESLGVQVILAGPSRRDLPLTADSGPASALTVAGLPLEPEEVETLAAATGVPEAPDPALPMAWSHLPPESNGSVSTAAALLGTLLNVLAITFLVLLLRLALQPEPSPRSPRSGLVLPPED